eukprot:TRINITY_DN11374_c0_g1_i2.p1 TRINITY_DN11374_c0_g1~~TRINITY_DN11374_c0_g1_i2.p1  ORF type:complete len:145 (+),score=3.35 TRINITY_DN11374_c0_g1_i2:316-750(+)
MSNGLSWSSTCSRCRRIFSIFGSGGGYWRRRIASAASSSVMQACWFVRTERYFIHGVPALRTRSALAKSRSSMATHAVTSGCSFKYFPISRALRSHHASKGSLVSSFVVGKNSVHSLNTGMSFRAGTTTDDGRDCSQARSLEMT